MTSLIPFEFNTEEYGLLCSTWFVAGVGGGSWERWVMITQVDFKWVCVTGDSKFGPSFRRVLHCK